MLADLVFRALIVAVDDYGRIDGRVRVLRGLLFPLRPEVTDKKLEGWLDELAQGPDAPIVRYEVDGRPYIALSGWEKHRGKSNRAKNSKCPEPASGRIRENPSNPPVGSTPVERESTLGGDRPEPPAEAAPSAPHPRGGASRRAERKTAVPDSLTPEDRDRVVEWARSQSPPISPAAVKHGWQVYLSKARANGYRYVDHARAFMNALGAGGEAWALKGFEDKPASRAYRRDETGQVLVPNEWRGLAG